jgi:hypothetical protein
MTLDGNEPAPGWGGLIPRLWVRYLALRALRRSYTSR